MQHHHGTQDSLHGPLIHPMKRQWVTAAQHTEDVGSWSQDFNRQPFNYRFAACFTN